MSGPRDYKKIPLQISWVKEPTMCLEEDKPNQIKVYNVPSDVKEKVLKTYFEVARSGGCKNAVADCKKIETGVYVVTFHDPQGM